jgi:hypothetical protein
MPKFPQAPEPKKIQLPATALWPMGTPKPEAKSTARKPVEKDIEAKQVSEALFAPEITATMEQSKPVVEPKTETEVKIESATEMPAAPEKSSEPKQDKAKGSYLNFIKQEIPQETPIIETGEAPVISEPKTGLVTSTPADKQSLENTAEVVHEYAPVMGTVIPNGELAGKIIPQEQESPITIQRVAQPQITVAVEHGKASSYAKAPSSAKAMAGKPADRVEPEATGKFTARDKIETTGSIKQEEIKAADVQYSVVHEKATPIGSSQAGTISSDIGASTIAATATAAVAPLVDRVTSKPTTQGTIKILPESATGLERIIVVPENSVEYGMVDAKEHTGKTTSNSDTIKRTPKVSTDTPIEHGRTQHEPARRGTATDVLRDTRPEELHRRTTTDPQIERSKIENARRRGNGGNGRRNPRRPARPAVVLPGAAAIHDPAVGPVPPINLGDEPEAVDNENGGTGRVPFPKIDPRPRPMVNNLPPNRAPQRTVLDDLEKWVIADKNKKYGVRFDKINRANSSVEQVLPSLHDLPSSVADSAKDFIKAYENVDEANEGSYSEFISSYNDIMGAIRREREAQQ